jgi:uncharacterized protein YpmS
LKPLSFPRLFFWLLPLIFAGIACNFPGSNSDTANQATLPSAQPEVTSPSTENDPPGQILFRISEQELTELVIEKLNSQAEPLLTEPQVSLRDGQVVVTGKVQQAGLSLSARMVLIPYLDESGVPYLEVDSMTLGPIPVPQEFQDQLSQAMNSALIQYFEQTVGNARLDSITISDGEMIITGR